jgi:hypothetical protein
MLMVEEVPDTPQAPGTIDWASWAVGPHQDLQRLQQRVHETLEAFNAFFNHIGIRKGWREAPFRQADVQVLFYAAAELVAVIRTRLDEQREGGIVLRQVEGSSQNFLWGWPPARSPISSRESQEEFVRGLVLSTLSDGNGLVEGLDASSVDGYLRTHPLFTAPVVPRAEEQSAKKDAEEDMGLENLEPD